MAAPTDPMSNSSDRKRGEGVSRILSKLKERVENGEYYDAHQMYRTLYFRYTQQNKYLEAIDLLYNGANVLLEHNQHNSGADLANLLVTAYEKSNIAITDQSINRLTTLLRKLDPNTVERHHLLMAAIKWSSSQDFPRGDPILHEKLALLHWQEKQYPAARYHFIHSDNGSDCAVMLVEYSVALGYPSETDMFITQAVLQYLCLNKSATAHVAFKKFTNSHPNIEPGPPFEKKPLLNFVALLLVAVNEKKVALFTMICEKYEPSIERDPSYSDYISKIGQIFFNKPRQGQNSEGGILGNLMSSLFGGDDDSDEADAVMVGAEDLD